MNLMSTKINCVSKRRQQCGQLAGWQHANHLGHVEVLF